MPERNLWILTERKLASSRVRAGIDTTNPFIDSFLGFSKDALTRHWTCPTGMFR